MAKGEVDCTKCPIELECVDVKMELYRKGCAFPTKCPLVAVIKLLYDIAITIDKSKEKT